MKPHTTAAEVELKAGLLHFAQAQQWSLVILACIIPSWFHKV